MDRYVLGIDTSNYTTSIALADKTGNIIYHEEKLLEVKKGNTGLRQSEAHFQHGKNLPEMLTALRGVGQRIAAVAASNRPRPVCGSYMPVFTAGTGYGKAISAALDVPYMEFSHQEGHIEAVRTFTPLKEKKEFLAFHLSGGTCELLKVKETSLGYDIDIIGGSKDISFGQVIDRIGVAMGLDFPAGKAMDRLAESRKNCKNEKLPLTRVKLRGLEFNLSGLETQAQNKIAEHPKDIIAESVFDIIGKVITDITKKAREETGIGDMIYIGGVASSDYVRRVLNASLDRIYFGELSADNSVGIALLGGRTLWP